MRQFISGFSVVSASLNIWCVYVCVRVCPFGLSRGSFGGGKDSEYVAERLRDSGPVGGAPSGHQFDGKLNMDMVSLSKCQRSVGRLGTLDPGISQNTLPLHSFMLLYTGTVGGSV